MIKGKTTTGFKYRVNKERVVNDRRFLAALRRGNSDDMMQQLEADEDIARYLLGNEQYDALMAHVAEPDGYVPNDKFSAEVMEIFDALQRDGDVKK